jgi:hypothetical protein
VSNSLAIATVTATLQRTLQQALNAAVVGGVAGAEVRASRPSAGGNNAATKGVDIYLLQVTPNAAMRGLDLPARNSSAELARRPIVALDLHYLLSFHGDEASFEPQRMLGIVMSALHARPILTRRAIRDTVADETFATFLQGSDLADQIDAIRLTPTSHNLEELSKIWSVFLQTPYTLSVAYQAGVVLIETEDAPHTAVPVREAARVFVGAVRRPVIEAISPQIVTRTETLSIRGTRLRSDATLVRFGSGTSAVPDAVEDGRMVVSIPDGLRAGVNTVAVVQSQAFEGRDGD